MSSAIEIFCCYSRKDQELLENLKSHLAPLRRQGLINIWNDTDITPGTNYEEEIKKHLDSAHIILLLVSPDFMNSDYCYSTEMEHAMERHNKGESRVVPIILRPVLFKDAPFGKIQALPKDAKPVRRWADPDDAFFDVAAEIEKIVKDLKRHLVGKANHNQGTFVAAEQPIKPISNGTWYLLVGDIFLFFLEYSRALEAFERINQTDPEIAYKKIIPRKCRALIRLHRYDEVVILYSQAINIHPEIPDYYIMKLKLLLQLERYNEVLEVYQQLIQLNPERTRYYFEKVDLLLQLKRYDEVLEVYQQLIQLNPNRTRFYVKKMDLLLQLKRYDEVLEVYQQLIQLNPNRTRYYIEKANLLLQLKRYNEVLEVYQQIIQLKPDHIHYYIKKGDLLLQLKRYNEALACYEETITLNIKSTDIHVDKGFALSELKRYDEALLAFERALENFRVFDYFFANSKYNRATIKKAKGDTLYQLEHYEDALTTYEEVIQSNHKDSSILTRIGNTLVKLQRYREALKIYKRAIKLNPHDPANFSGQAFVYEQLAQDAYLKARQLLSEQ